MALPFCFPLIPLILPRSRGNSKFADKSYRTILVNYSQWGFPAVLINDAVKVLFKCRQLAKKPATWRFEPSTFWEIG